MSYLTMHSLAWRLKLLRRVLAVIRWYIERLSHRSAKLEAETSFR